MLARPASSCRSRAARVMRSARRQPQPSLLVSAPDGRHKTDRGDNAEAHRMRRGTINTQPLCPAADGKYPPHALLHAVSCQRAAGLSHRCFAADCLRAQQEPRVKRAGRRPGRRGGWGRPRYRHLRRARSPPKVPALPEKCPWPPWRQPLVYQTMPVALSTAGIISLRSCCTSIPTRKARSSRHLRRFRHQGSCGALRVTGPRMPQRLSPLRMCLPRGQKGSTHRDGRELTCRMVDLNALAEVPDL
jgi:hypothetical protein